MLERIFPAPRTTDADRIDGGGFEPNRDVAEVEGCRRQAIKK